MRGAYSETRSDRAALVKPGGPVVGCVRRDPVCGEAMPGRRMSTCSDQCRARQSRLARGPLPVSVARELRASLTMSRGTAWQRTVTRERNGSGEGGPGMVGPATRKAPLHERIPTVENARLYRDKRLSPAEIATRFGVTRHAVLSRLRADGIRQGAKAPRGRRGHEARTQDGTPGRKLSTRMRHSRFQFSEPQATFGPPRSRVRWRRAFHRESARPARCATPSGARRARRARRPSRWGPTRPASAAC